MLLAERTELIGRVIRDVSVVAEPQSEISRKAGVTEVLITTMRRSARRPSRRCLDPRSQGRPFRGRNESWTKIGSALEAAGIECIDENGGGRLRSSRRKNAKSLAALILDQDGGKRRDADRARPGS
jgi:hypothetical protein